MERNFENVLSFRWLREQLFQRKLAALEETKDGLGRELDEEIKEMVAVLHCLGVGTRQSCGGHMDRALPYPWVDLLSLEHMQARDDETSELASTARRARPLWFKYDDQIPNDKWLPEDRQLAEQLDAIEDSFLDKDRQVRRSVQSWLKEYQLRHAVNVPFDVELSFGRLMPACLANKHFSRHDEILRTLLSTETDRRSFLEEARATLDGFTVWLKEQFLSGNLP